MSLLSTEVEHLFQTFPFRWQQCIRGFRFLRSCLSSVLNGRLKTWRTTAKNTYSGFDRISAIKMDVLPTFLYIHFKQCQYTYPWPLYVALTMKSTTLFVWWTHKPRICMQTLFRPNTLGTAGLPNFCKHYQAAECIMRVLDLFCYRWAKPKLEDHMLPVALTSLPGVDRHKLYSSCSLFMLILHLLTLWGKLGSTIWISTWLALCHLCLATLTSNPHYDLTLSWLVPLKIGCLSFSSYLLHPLEMLDQEGVSRDLLTYSYAPIWTPSAPYKTSVGPTPHLNHYYYINACHLTFSSQCRPFPPLLN